jgi:diguanylate cyclase (GGDEF)-like protein
MKKHALHDHETHLFNKKYFLSELKTTCARAVRYKFPLSIVSISVNNLDNYNKKTKKRIVKAFGKLLKDTTQESDVVCRYDTNHFAVLLEDPGESHAQTYQDKLEEAVAKYDFRINTKLELNFTISHLEEGESAETFAERAIC